MGRTAQFPRGHTLNKGCGFSLLEGFVLLRWGTKFGPGLDYSGQQRRGSSQSHLESWTLARLVRAGIEAKR